MNRFPLWTVVALLFLAPGGCHLDQGDGTTMRTEIAADFDRSAPADVAVLPVSSATGLDDDSLASLRRRIYTSLIEKDYAPGGVEYVDKLLRSRGLDGVRLSSRLAWNTAPFKGLFFYDGIAMISVDRFERTDGSGVERIEIHGKMALFDAETMALLYEKTHSSSLRQRSTESRDDFQSRVIREFAEQLVSPLPRKPAEPGINTGNNS